MRLLERLWARWDYEDDRIAKRAAEIAKEAGSERIAELDAEIDRLRELQKVHRDDLAGMQEAYEGVLAEVTELEEECIALRLQVVGLRLQVEGS